jgi:hypothetical protein
MDGRLITGPPVPSFTNRIRILRGAVLVLLAVSSTAWAQPSLSLDSTSGSPGQTVTSTLTVQNNGPAVALQFEVQFDAAKLSPGSVTAGADLAPQVFNAFSPTAGVLRVVVTPVFGPTLPGIHNGILLNLPFAIAANAAGGATALALANVLLSNATAGSVTPGALTNGTLTIQSLASTALAAVVLPLSRSVKINVPATAFVAILNIGATPATNVSIAVKDQKLPVAFTYQTLNASNQVTGSPNTPVTIPPGGGQSFVITLQSSVVINPTEVEFVFAGNNTLPVRTIPGVNTLQFSVSPPPAADVVALAATLANNGIVDIPGATGTGVFSVITINFGDSEQITVTEDTGTVTLPISSTMCQTNPATGCCQQGCVVPTETGVTTTIGATQTPTFAFFVKGMDTVPFDPAGNRIFVRFKNGSNKVRGATSVAVRTQ